MTAVPRRLAADVPRRLAVLFGLAALGVLVVFALVAHALGGLPVLLGYLAAVGTALAVAVRRLRALARQQQRRAAARTCTCCSGSHGDPVQVI